ncbi:MAG: hypothetical protein ABSH34_19060 [Verrucomicrobiota bacterium]|jgi:hypothetical protein
MPLAQTEDIVRAVCTDKWDGQRLSPSLFVGENVSVSRLAVVPLADHWDLFRQHVEKPPERWLELIAEINVGRLQAIGRSQNPAVALTVEPKPVDWNPAHAEIPQKITRGLAGKILPELALHHPPPRDQE